MADLAAASAQDDDLHGGTAGTYPFDRFCAQDDDLQRALRHMDVTDVKPRTAKQLEAVCKNKEHCAYVLVEALFAAEGASLVKQTMAKKNRSIAEKERQRRSTMSQKERRKKTKNGREKESQRERIKKTKNGIE